MNISRAPLAVMLVGAVLLAVVSATTGYWVARRTSVPPPANPVHAANAVNGAGPERRVLYWYDPMVPNQRFDKPGKSPFMDMQLIPKYDDELGSGDSGGIRIDPGIVQNLGVRFTRVERASLPRSVDAVGALGFNQREVAVIQARSGGFVTRVYARAPGDVLDSGAPIVDLLVPEWTGAQTEFLLLLNNGDPALIDAARQRLLLLGMTSDLVARIEAAREPRATVTIRSPRGGVLESLDVREGMTIASGATLARINGLATVWLEAAIPEAQAALAKEGATVDARLAAYPSRSFKGRLVAVLPQANVETRTVRVRVELANPDGQLRPGMFAQARIASGEREPVLYVPSEALIRTGTRTVAIVADDGGRFIPTEVQVGDVTNGNTVILSGLTEGQRVVSSGQFLIDSEARLKGVLARFATPGGPR